MMTIALTRDFRRIALIVLLGSLWALVCAPLAWAQETQIQDQAVPKTVGIHMPASPGRVSDSANGITLDVSNANDGYVTAKCEESSGAKVQITHAGQATYTYNLRAGGQYEVFPLTGGDGEYKIIAYNYVYGDQYAVGLSRTVNVCLRDPMLPFLYPNQYVNFEANSRAVAKAGELSQDAGNRLSIVSNVYNYVIGNVVYDTEKARLVTEKKLPGYLPDVDDILSSKKGICFDYAALMAAMLRSQGIPTRMDVGYVSGGVYHAWLDVYVPEVGWVNGIIRFDGKNWTLMDPTFAASQGANSQYAGTGFGYQTLYHY